MSKNSLLKKYLNVGGAVFLTVIIPVIFLVSSLDLVGGAGLFPILMSVIMLLCGAMSFFKKVRKGDILGAPLQIDISFPKLLALTVLLFLFIPMSEFLGFYATNFIYIVAGFLFLVGGLSRKAVLQAIIVASAFVLTEKLIFYDLLTILTPIGILF